MATTCAALKPDGVRCRNAPRATSKYCASHKAYRPKGTARKKLDSLKRARAMKVVRKRARTTSGGKGAIRNRPAAIKVMGARAKCGARTGSGSACKNMPRPASKYCASHKGYRPPRAKKS